MAYQTFEQLVTRVGELLIRSDATLVTAESCTGGWVAGQLTSIEGSSNWFDRGYVTYSNDSKIDMLGVSEQTIIEDGAVSQQTVLEMVQGVLSNSPAYWALSVSGVAGPGGGTDKTPVGTVCFAWASKVGYLRSEQCHFTGRRAEVREQAVKHALAGLIKAMDD